ncbi:WG repeat-containing protein [Clostridium sp. DL1XJH146]
MSNDEIYGAVGDSIAEFTDISKFCTDGYDKYSSYAIGLNPYCDGYHKFKPGKDGDIKENKSYIVYTMKDGLHLLGYEIYHYDSDEDGFGAETEYVYGYIDKDYNVVIPFTYWHARPFSDGLAHAATNRTTWFYINKKGQKVIDGPFKQAGRFRDGLACVQDYSGKYYYIDKNGKDVFQKKYFAAYEFSYGFAVVCDVPNKEYYINKRGKAVFNKIFKSAGPFVNEKAFVHFNEKEIGYIDMDGKEVERELK